MTGESREDVEEVTIFEVSLFFDKAFGEAA